MRGWLLAFLLTMLSGPLCRAQSPALLQVADDYLDRHDIVYLEPETDSFNGFPLGNGDLGGMLWFTDEGLELQLNKADLYDRPARGRMALRSAGRLKIDFGVPCYSYMHLSDFEARLSLRKAEVNVDSSTPFADTEVSSWVDAGSNVWIIRCRAGYGASLPTGAVNRIVLERWGSRSFGGWYGAREGTPAEGLGLAKVAGRGRDLVLEEQFEGGLRFAVACRLVGCLPEIRQVSDRACEFVTPLDSVQSYAVLVSVATSDEADDPVREAVSLLDRAEARTVAALREEHREWWGRFWARSFIHLEDDYLENIYYMRRYLMGSGSRGKYPLPFNGGLWITNYDHRQWVTPHHWNTQESYWGLAAQHDCDLMRPYIDTYAAMMPQGRALARKKGVKDGLLITEAHDFDGNMVSADWGNMTTNDTPASQIAEIMWAYYAYTLDRDYLRSTLYPFMKEAAEFYLNFLQWDQEKKEYFIFPAQPYEHEWSSRLKNTITDRYMIESLFRHCIRAARDLGTDRAKVRQWRHVLEHLWEPPVLEIPGKEKTFGLAFTEDGQPYPDAQSAIQGYHFDAHTTAVFPAGVLGLDQAGTSCFGIARGIALRHPHNRNAITPGAIVSARLGLGDKVLERLRCSVEYLQHFNQGLFYNLDHWYGLSRYADRVPDAELRTQRDYLCDSRLLYDNPMVGRSGYRAKPFVQCGMETLGIFGTAVNEMLLQSHEGKIRVFPAIPSRFAAAFTLWAEGAFRVSSAIDSLGNIPFVEIMSQAGQECRIRNPWDDDPVRVTDGNGHPVAVLVDCDHVLSFATKAGESYVLTRQGTSAPVSLTYPGLRNERPKHYGEAMLGKERTYR